MRTAPVSIAEAGERAALGIVVLLAAAGYIYIFGFGFRFLYPPVWIDEIHFLAPAAPLLSGRLFNADSLALPQGIFWLPSGFYVFNSIAFQIFGDALSTARGLSFVCVLCSAWLLRSVLQAARPEWTIIAIASAVAWFASAPVLIAANLARPEALELMFCLGALLCALTKRPLAAASLAAIAALTHPLLSLPALAAAVLGCLEAPRFDIRAVAKLPRSTIALLLTAVTLLAWEAHQYVTHASLYNEHMAFQFQRKADRSQGLIVFIVLGLTMAGGGLLAWRSLTRTPMPQREAMLCATIGGCFASVFFYGKEMWYYPFLVTAAILQLPLIAFVTGKMLGTHATRIMVSAGVAAAALATWAWALSGDGFLHFRATPQTLATLRAERADIDAAIAAYVAAHPTQRIAISAALAAPYLSELHAANSRFVAPIPTFSGPIGDIDAVIYAEAAYPDIAETAAELAPGVATAHSRSITSPSGAYRIRIDQVDARN